MKNVVLLISCLFSLSSLFGQSSSNCSINPLEYTDYIASGQFAFMQSEDWKINDVVMVRQAETAFGDPLEINIDVLKGNIWGNRVLEKEVSSFPYDLSKVNGRMVAGDFDGDKLVDDFALLYRVNSSQMRVDVFKSNGSNYPTFTKYTYLTLNGYDADKITGRIVSGDFDRDGREDDIAMFFDYGDGETRIHMLKGMGNYFSYQGAAGWWSATGYTAGKVTDRVVSGDFDRDGKKDDIAAFYDYGEGETRIHVWLSDGSSLSYQGAAGWWSATGYTASKITGRVVSVNIDSDGKAFDDIAVFYDYGGAQTRMHIFESEGSGFNYSGNNGWWIGNNFTASKITGRVAAINSGGGIGLGIGYVGPTTTDIIAFYDHGPTTNKYHIWKAENSIFGSPSVTYQQHKFCATKSAFNGIEGEQGVNIRTAGIEVKAYPNPTTDQLTISLAEEALKKTASVKIYSLTGQLMYSEQTNDMKISVDISHYESGIYLLRVHNELDTYVLRIVKE